MDAFRWLARLLNEYANLLLVIVTVIYVCLAWLNLKAFQESQSRPARSQHLSDIKEYVVGPLLSWLDDVVNALSGVGTPYLTSVEFINNDGNIPIGMELHPRGFRLSNHSAALLDDAAKAHFPEEFKKYNSFRQILESLLLDICTSSKECCVEIRTSLDLPRLASVNRIGRFESMEEFVHACLPYFLVGNEPLYHLQHTNLGSDMTVFIQTHMPAIAADSEENIQRWLPAAIQTINHKWTANRFTSRITDVREDARSLQKAIQGISFVQEIPGKCKYIGG